MRQAKASLEVVAVHLGKEAGVVLVHFTLPVDGVVNSGQLSPVRLVV